MIWKINKAIGSRPQGSGKTKSAEQSTRSEHAMNITRHKINRLKNNDKILARVIDKVGVLKNLEYDENHFKNASKIIVDQQISFKAARAIWNKLDALVSDWDPKRVNVIDTQDMRNAGLSTQKVTYIKTLAKTLHAETFTFEHLSRLNDDDATQELIKIKGFGRWSAAMFLIFSLKREDIFSADDGGLKRAVMNLYNLDEESYQKKIEEISLKWSPYRSIASLYLWAWSD